MNNQNLNMNERFPSEYFSGSDIKIYFNDIMIDEIVQLTFTIQEQSMPIFGYNSDTFDAIVRGSRIIQGQFAINFKKQNYLQEAIREAQDKVDYNSTEDINRESNMYHYEELENSFYDDNEDFEEKAAEQADSIWNSSTNDTSYNDKFQFNEESFDIKIAYGPYNKYSQDNINSKFRKTQQNYSQNVNPGTVKALNDVYLVGNSQQLEMSGQPVKEVYNFVAKDMDRR